MGTLLAKNAAVMVTMDEKRRELRDAGLFARDGKIERSGRQTSFQPLPTWSGSFRPDSLARLCEYHHHLDQTLTRNLPAAQNNNLFPWLKVHYRLWARRTPEASRSSTLVGLAELAASGCTTVFDHSYVFPNGCRVDDQIAAAQEIGVRFHACRGSMSLGESRGGLPPDDCVEDEEAILKDCRRVIEAYHDESPGAMTRIVLGPCSPFSVSTDLLKESARLAAPTRCRCTRIFAKPGTKSVHSHRYQLRPVAWMETLGWLGEDVWFAHAVHVDDDEIRQFARTGVGARIVRVRTCGSRPELRRSRSISRPASRSAWAWTALPATTPRISCSRRGRPCCWPGSVLGCSRPRGRGQFFFLSQSDPIRAHEWMTAREVLEMATRGGAAVLGRDDIGSLEPGKCADFFSINLHTVDYAGA